MNGSCRTTALSLFSAAFALGGCAGDVGGDATGAPADDEVSMRSSAIDSTSCAAASVPNDAVSSGAINFTSPRTYSNPGCSSAVVAQINNISANFTQPGTVRSAGIDVRWVDNDLTTPGACRDTTMTAYLFRKTGSTWTFVAGEEVIGGARWIQGPILSYCAPPSLFFNGSHLLTGQQTYRVAATAQRLSTGATRALRIETVFAVNNPT